MMGCVYGKIHKRMGSIPIGAGSMVELMSFSGWSKMSIMCENTVATPVDSFASGSICADHTSISHMSKIALQQTSTSFLVERSGSIMSVRLEETVKEVSKRSTGVETSQQSPTEQGNINIREVEIPKRGSLFLNL